jgi:hypothetical protein
LDKILYQSEITRIAEGLKALHSLWTPHPAQIEIGRALLKDGIKDVFAQCGRNFGKTELVAYLLWRYAWCHSGSENYYFSPYQNQSREILWASGRVQGFGPKEWIKSVNVQEMRITFINDSFIRLAGSDNVESYRGVKPKGLTVYDEFKDFRPEFHDAYDPNRAAFDSPLFIIGTPPTHDGQFTALAKAFSEDPAKRFYKFPTDSNPHIKTEWLEKKKAQLYALGEGDKWEREYMAEFVRGGANAVFPMFSDSMIMPHEKIMKEIWRDRRKLDWFCWYDPAGSSCFAVLFVAINRYNKQLWILDELYLKDQKAMTTGNVGQLSAEIMEDLCDVAEWIEGYDEAESWFRNEMIDNFGRGLIPSQKAKSDKLSGVSLIKDAMLEGLFTISDRCKWLFWEMENYQKDDKGKIPKGNDHLLDCLRYILDAAAYKVRDDDEPIPVEADPMWRGATPQHDFPEMGDDLYEEIIEWD